MENRLGDWVLYIRFIALAVAVLHVTFDVAIVAP